MPNYQQTKKHLESFTALPTGWHYGQGVAASRPHIRQAVSLLSAADSLGFTRFNAFPGIEGEVQLTIYDEANFYAFTIEPSCGITVLHERDREEVFYQEGLSLISALTKLEDFAFEPCHTPELFIQSISIEREKGLPTLLSEIQAAPLPISQAKESQLSILNAQSKPAIPSADTSKNSILLQLVEILLSTGSSQKTPSFTDASGSKRTVVLETRAITI